MPSDIHSIDLTRSRLTGEDGFNTRFRQGVADSALAKNQRTADAISRHVIGGHARRREHLFVADR
jgi:hypothetical protein